jgi:hypothetical protein
VAATAQGRLRFLGFHPMLEDQMCTWDPSTTKDSPDRVDALVFAATGLLIQPPKGYKGAGVGTSLVAKSASYARLPSIRSGSGSNGRGSRMRP